MDDAMLERTLQSVGKNFFISELDDFFNNSHSNQDVADLPKSKEDYTEKSCRSQVSHAPRIIDAGRTKDGLRKISRSIRVPANIRDQAVRITDNLR